MEQRLTARPACWGDVGRNCPRALGLGSAPERTNISLVMFFFLFRRSRNTSIFFFLGLQKHQRLHVWSDAFEEVIWAFGIPSNQLTEDEPFCFRRWPLSSLSSDWEEPATNAMSHNWSTQRTSPRWVEVFCSALSQRNSVHGKITASSSALTPSTDRGRGEHKRNYCPALVDAPGRKKDPGAQRGRILSMRQLERTPGVWKFLYKHA